MRIEDLENALNQATRQWVALRDERNLLKTKELEFKERQHKLAARAEGTDWNEYERISRLLFGTLIQLKLLEPSFKEADLRKQALQSLKTDWYAFTPAFSTGSAHFFVRDYLIEEGLIVSYDPFWIDSCIVGRDTPDAQLHMELYDLWRAGLPIVDRNGTTRPEPYFVVAKPFGPATDAAMAACSRCSQSAYVLGYKEFSTRPGSSEFGKFRQSLYTLCLHCPRLTLLAERLDEEVVDLHTHP